MQGFVPGLKTIIIGEARINELQSVLLVHRHAASMHNAPALNAESGPELYVIYMVG